MNPTLARLQAALADRYTIERELGQGGMATVYLASDLKHDRKVALKLLKPELAAVLGAERFVVEIKTTAGLSHPHILPLFDSGTADGFLYYVMPFIEGETLRDKLNRESQLGVEEALRIATEVADALDYAHRHGVIHRDIKPENILLHDGRPMVADFGIALAVSAAAGGRMTETGLSLGTPHYMSPEQATAEKEITGRSDIYSLGSVLYEMLAGEPPHLGGSAQQIIMKIITETPSLLTARRKATPVHVAAAVARALEKLPADRFETAKAFAEALRDPHFTHGSLTPGALTAGTVDARPAAGARRTRSVAAALAVLGLSTAAWGLLRGPSDAVVPSIHLTLDVDARNADLRRFDVSPDGDAFAFATSDGIAVREAGRRDFRVLAGTRGGESPVFSPDGKWIAYTDDGRLRRIAITGGAPLSLIPGDTLRPSRPFWGRDGSIVFEIAQRLYLLPANGGAVRQLSEQAHAESPRLLPDGSGILYVDSRDGVNLMLYDLATDSAAVLIPEASEGQYVETGHIVYAHPSDGLLAAEFDLKRHAVRGSPVPVIDDLRTNGGMAAFAVSPNGTLVYRAGLDQEARLLTIDASGRRDTLPIAPSNMGYASFSPDGRNVAVTLGSSRGSNRFTWLFNRQLGTLRQFTFNGGGHSPVWSPDGRWIAFSMEAPDSDAEDLYVQPVDGSAPPRRVASLPGDQHATAWPSDSILVFNHEGDIMLVDPSVSDAAPRAFLSAQADESELVVSPDGRHAAYASNESGSTEIYVRTFPVPGGTWRVSLGGGWSPRWSPDGRTIYHRSAEGQTIRAARVRTTPNFEVLSRDDVTTVPAAGGAWDVNPRTGEILITQTLRAVDTRIVVVTNWYAELQAKMKASSGRR